MVRDMTMNIGKHLLILVAVAALAALIYGGSALFSQPVMADPEEGYAITVNDGVALEKFEGQDNYWQAELKYNEDGDESGDILIYTLEDPKKVPVGMEINIQFTAKDGYSEDLLQIEGKVSGETIDLNLEESATGWTGTFLMPKEDIDITAHIEENSGELDAEKTESAGPSPEDEMEDPDESDDPDKPIVNHGFIVNGDTFIDKDKDGVWYYEFDHGKVYLDDSKSLKKVRAELTDKDYTMDVKIRNHETAELYKSCEADSSVTFEMPDADLDIEVTFEKAPEKATEETAEKTDEKTAD